VGYRGCEPNKRISPPESLSEKGVLQQGKGFDQKAIRGRWEAGPILPLRTLVRLRSRKVAEKLLRSYLKLGSLGRKPTSSRSKKRKKGDLKSEGEGRWSGKRRR